MKDLAQVAAAYAARLGWPVFPCSVDKTPLTRHGCLDATTDLERIRAWRWPSIGVAAARFLALDVDPRAGGDDSLDELEAVHGKLPATVEALTGGGGRHVLFELPAGELRWHASIAPGLDIKAGPSAYLIVAPSPHPSGRSYTWEVSSRPSEVPLAIAPAWLLARAVNLEAGPVEVTGSVARCFVARAFAAAGMVRAQIDARRIAVRCPFELEHTGGAPGSRSSSVVLAPTDMAPRGTFYCAHSSHGRRSTADALAALPAAAIAEVLADELYEAEERAAIQAEAA